MVPGLVSLIWVVAAGNGICIFQWFFWGYSLAFSSTASNGFIGNLYHFGLRNVLDEPSPGSPLIPEILYSFFQMEFACVTVAILVGGIAERGRVFPAVIFVFLWTTLVYCPLACWAWNPSGWAFKWGVLDFAGGGPVEIGSGLSGLAFAYILGPRHQSELVNFRPHNVSLVCLGTFLLWFGWLGFNGGSAFGANVRAVIAVWNSMLGAGMAGMVWCIMDWRYEKRWSMVGFCSGCIGGLVAATPSSGFVHPWAGLVIGILSGVGCNLATKIKFLLKIDDALDLFAEHAIGGIIGLICNAFFADNAVISLDGVNTSIEGGFLDRNWKQLYIQVAYIAATSAYSFVVTALIAKCVDLVPGCRLRGTREDEALGMDEVEIGEFATDYIEVGRNFDDGFGKGSSSSSDATTGPGPVAAGDRHGHAENELHWTKRPSQGGGFGGDSELSPVDEEKSTSVEVESRNGIDA
ncbi:low affinity high capacity ammonium permease [Paramarasmius palmivorus]|uniref:Ammonium transporter n=1 Tax=Paramarasmius palmivorus TaxID=297713 RepID=A0AAW0E6V3_9AGAR